MKVFLSSTAQDLVAHRQVADDTILRLSHESIVMERFGPLPGEPVAECERKARESDVVVCIVAHRYGFVPEAGKGSITRREVEAARSAGKDVLVWIVDDDHPWTEKKEQDRLTDPTVLADPARIEAVAADVQELLDFKNWLRGTFTYEAFTTPDDLGRKIAVRLGAYVQQEAKPARVAPVRAEVRIVHALQPAPHFRGREALVDELAAWVTDLASPDRVWSLVAAGGTGKTAVVERVVAQMEPSEASVLVWSFYERPDADAFLRECNQLFLGEDEGPPGGRLERLERGLRDGRPHLIVLDGLERVQEDAGGGRVRGELSDNTLKLLLRALAAGLGRARALVTSRYPLVDLQDWTNRGYCDTRLDDLSPEAAVSVLRGWGVSGDDAALRAATEQVGHHALSVAVLGSYLRFVAGGRIEAVKDFELDSVTGEDPRAAKLARVLGYYAEELPDEERELLARLSVFPRGVTIELLGVLVDAGGEVAGLLLNARPRLVALLRSLRDRGLVFEYHSDAVVTWTAHPFLRERFRELLGCPAEQVFAAVAESLGTGLEKSPDTNPREPAVLDRYERLIEATRLAGREQEAFELFHWALGGYAHLAQLGEYERGYRILAGFSRTGLPEDLGATITPELRAVLFNSLALLSIRLGRLAEAQAIQQFDGGWESLDRPDARWRVLHNSSEVAFGQGRLADSHALAAEALALAKVTGDPSQEIIPLAGRANAAHALGDIAAAGADFAAASELKGRPLVSHSGAQRTRHHLDLGELAVARVLADQGLDTAHRNDWKHELPWFHALFARIELAEAGDPAPHLDEIRDWTSRTGEMEFIVEAHLLAARHQLARGDPQAAVAEAEIGLLHAVSCGYGLLRIQLLITLAYIRLAWPDAPEAIRAAREALDLAAHPDCGYAWGEADAAQAWGEAFFSNHEFALARRAFERALEVRRRIEHPGASETQRWLDRLP
jgi:tetratricopeptide (TPR) repeat protein